MNINEARCPECGNRLKLGAHPHKGQRIVCPDCERNLTIINLNPIELDLLAPERSSKKAKKGARINEVPCPECDELIKLNTHSSPGFRLKCGNCNTLLEVVDTNPLELDIAFDINTRSARSKKFGGEKW